MRHKNYHYKLHSYLEKYPNRKTFYITSFNIDLAGNNDKVDVLFLDMLNAPIKMEYSTYYTMRKYQITLNQYAPLQYNNKLLPKNSKLLSILKNV